jgi:hypothetical protein
MSSDIEDAIKGGLHLLDKFLSRPASTDRAQVALLKEQYEALRAEHIRSAEEAVRLTVALEHATAKSEEAWRANEASLQELLSCKMTHKAREERFRALEQAFKDTKDNEAVRHLELDRVRNELLAAWNAVRPSPAERDGQSLAQVIAVRMERIAMLQLLNENQGKEHVQLRKLNETLKRKRKAKR